MKLINKQVVNLPTNMCHYIIQERNKFLIEHGINPEFFKGFK